MYSPHLDIHKSELLIHDVDILCVSCLLKLHLALFVPMKPHADAIFLKLEAFGLTQLAKGAFVVILVLAKKVLDLGLPVLGLHQLNALVIRVLLGHLDPQVDGCLTER